ncbi:MAG: YqgE/AlgH family protein [Deltaproteobacteria bacterium]
MGIEMGEQVENSLKGHFLIAMPEMADFNFSHTVTCISEHTHRGALGIIINRVLPTVSGKTIFDELKLESAPGSESIPIHIGGPVHANEIFILHGPPFEWESCLMITEKLAMSNSMDIIAAIAAGEGPEAFVISLGCAGWGPGQLESEITQNAWLTSPVAIEVVFSEPIESRWERTVKMIGINPALLSSTPGHA